VSAGEVDPDDVTAIMIGSEWHTIYPDTFCIGIDWSFTLGEGIYAVAVTPDKDYPAPAFAAQLADGGDWIHAPLTALQAVVVKQP
jgi:hypothetical protein